MLGGKDGGVNKVQIEHNEQKYVPPHLSKDQNIHVQTGDTICVSTPGGGGYEGALKRNPELVQKDVQRGYYTIRQAQDLFGVVLSSAGVIDDNATKKLRGQ